MKVPSGKDGLLVAQMVKTLPALQETWVRSLGWEISWKKRWRLTPVFLPGELHGQRSLVGYSPRTHRVGHNWATNTHIGKEPTCQCKRHKRHRFDPWVRKIPGGGHGNPLQYSCLGESLGQRTLVGYSPWGFLELDMTEATVCTHAAYISVFRLSRMGKCQIF